MIVENRVHDAILTSMGNVVLPRVEKAVRSITESLMRWPNSMVQNPDPRDFSGNTENTPLMLAPSWEYLNTDQVRNDETRNVEAPRMTTFQP